VAGSEGPWVKAGVLLTIFTVILTYVGLAASNHWPPFHTSADYRPVSNTPPGGPDTQVSSKISSAQLSSSLLAAQELGQAATTGNRGTDLSATGPLCGGSLNGVAATAYEGIYNTAIGRVLTEAIRAWNTVALAGQFISADRQVLNTNRTCSSSYNGLTFKYGPGDYPGVPPSNCTNPGQYFATQYSVTGSSAALRGYLAVAQCGSITVTVEAAGYGRLSLQTVNGYLGDATANLPA
jgi:hypothetical protein